MLAWRGAGDGLIILGAIIGGRMRNRWYYILFLPPLLLLWVPHYNRIEPQLAGIPFFYWYQMAWVVITAGLTFIVYRLDKRRAR